MNTTADIPAPPPGRSWRNIRQEVSAPAMSRKGRRRQIAAWLKLGALFAFVVAAGWGIFLVAHSWETDRTALATAVQSEPVRHVVLITDGVLTQSWAAGELALPKSASLMSLELRPLRDRLLTSGQVRIAVLARQFPDTLVVTLQERTPVARVQAGDSFGATKQLLVAKDGVVYDGLNYSKTMLTGLPWLDGIRLVKSGTGFEPVAGMADVASLLATAQQEAPHLYRGWLIVSLARLASDDEIMVRAQDIPEIIFSRKNDFFKQVARLDYVIDAARVLPDPTLKSIDLSLNGQVPVRLERAPDQLTVVAQPSFQIQPPQRKGQRDL